MALEVAKLQEEYDYSLLATAQKHATQMASQRGLMNAAVALRDDFIVQQITRVHSIVQVASDELKRSRDPKGLGGDVYLHKVEIVKDFRTEREEVHFVLFCPDGTMKGFRGSIDIFFGCNSIEQLVLAGLRKAEEP